MASGQPSVSSSQPWMFQGHRVPPTSCSVATSICSLFLELAPGPSPLSLFVCISLEPCCSHYNSQSPHPPSEVDRTFVTPIL